MLVWFIAILHKLLAGSDSIEDISISKDVRPEF